MENARRPARWLALAILPALFLIVGGRLERDRGPLWLGTNSDPSYQYLMSALLLAHGVAPAHTDHPGTTSQALGAFVFSLSAHEGDIDERTTAVLARPEDQLAIILWSQRILVSGVFLIAGWAILERTGRLMLALVIQGVPLLQLGSHRAMLFFAPEALLLPLAFGLGVLLALRSLLGDPRRSWPLDLAMALVCGAGIVTKITFAPLCLLPLFAQRSWRRAIIIALLMGGSAVAFLLPIRSEWSRMLSWFGDLAGHQGIYGGGRRGFVDWAAYPENVLRMATADPVLLIAIVGSVALWLLARARQASDPRVMRHARELLILGLVQLLGVLLVSKHPHHAHYLLPLSATCALNAVLALELLGHVKWRHALRVATAIGLLAVASACFAVREYAGTLRTNAAQQFRMKQAADQLAGLRIDYYRSSSPEFALYFGDSSARHFFGRSLDTLYPGRVFYNLFAGRFETFRYRLRPLDVFTRPPPILFHGDHNIENATLPPGVARVPVEKNNVARIERLEPRP